MSLGIIEKGPKFGVRHVQTILLFFCFVVNFMERLVVSVAVVAMTNAATTNPNFPEYQWNAKQISYILSSVFWGMIIGMIPGSFLCRRCGAKFTMMISILGSSVMGVITPICIPFGGWKIYCAIRIIQGIFQGLFFPCTYDHLAKWSPIEERTMLGALCHTGLIIGTILSIAVSGFIAKSSLGWPGISYVTDGIGLVLCVFWIILADDSPMTSRFISTEEKNYILLSQQKVERSHKRIPIPWKAICTSRPFLSLVITQATEGWGHSTVLAQLPLYMRGVHKMDITSNAIFSSMPYVAMFVMSFVYLVFASFLMKKKNISLTVLKKSINTMSMWIPTVTLIAVGFLDESNKSLAIVLMIVTVGSNAGVTIGQGMNSIELSPNHASTLISIILGIVSCVSLASPLYAGYIVEDQTDRKQWQIVFLTAALMDFFGNLQYLFFGTTKTQPWDDENYLLRKDDDSESPGECRIKSIKNGKL
ncbi:putative inorganic phosphate cotransporter [Eupeodes corollae]|uniref:putative inorganic phosphate cotransporter n=1 Tax=Eupeodes corollae TaxID=290404 RepID=UPI0024900B22|nr:putative inorganic phosphate cotransporter [Eupeodes corollae]